MHSYPLWLWPRFPGGENQCGTGVDWSPDEASWGDGSGQPWWALHYYAAP